MNKRLAFYTTIYSIYLMVCCGFSSCTKKGYPSGTVKSEYRDDRFIIIDHHVLVTEEQIFDKEIILYPGAFLETSGNGKIVFTKPFSILGQYQVFDKNINIQFDKGIVSVFNPVWFGANGYDDEDDTEAIAKLFEIVSRLQNAVRIEIPIGKFILSQQITIESALAEKAIIHIQGVSNSNSGISGSSFVWQGESNESMVKIRNVSNSVFENLDFNAMPGKYPRHNLELRPFSNQISFQKCSFGGCAGEGSANVNLNDGSDLQVSEIVFDNCMFRGVISNDKITSHGVIGGWANTKDFYFRNCSFGAYAGEALKFTTTDVLMVEGCSFFENDVDISCGTCKSYLVSNYSEGSAAFWSATASSNFNATTMINNQYTGVPKDQFVIRDGSGTLVLINNNFGTGNYNAEENRIRWEENEFSMIYSIGNVFKNSDTTRTVFFNRSNIPFNVRYIESIGDLGGVLGEGRKKLEIFRKN
jgi:hypothetical protein